MDCPSDSRLRGNDGGGRPGSTVVMDCPSDSRLRGNDGREAAEKYGRESGGNGSKSNGNDGTRYNGTKGHPVLFPTPRPLKIAVFLSV